MSDTTTQNIELVLVATRTKDDFGFAEEAQAEGYRVLHATCGDHALRLPRSEASRIWLIAIHLDDMSGLDLLDLLRKRYPNHMFILVGESCSQEEEKSARQHGATLYTCKPITVELIRAIPVPQNHHRLAQLPVHLKKPARVPAGCPPPAYKK